LNPARGEGADLIQGEQQERVESGAGGAGSKPPRGFDEVIDQCRDRAAGRTGAGQFLVYEANSGSENGLVHPRLSASLRWRAESISVA
jgi:hypothetical protein